MRAAPATTFVLVITIKEVFLKGTDNVCQQGTTTAGVSMETAPLPPDQLKAPQSRGFSGKGGSSFSPVAFQAKAGSR